MMHFCSKIKKSWNDFKIKEKNGEVFAKGLCGKKLFLIFVILSIFGTYYEQILNLIRYYYSEGIIFWESRSGVFYGPFSPIYGAGAILILVLFGRKKRPWHQTLLYGSLFGGIFEYLISFLQQTFTHTVSWNYSNHFLNINGRTTIPFMLVWGLLSLALIEVVYPFLSRWIEKIPLRLGTILYYILFTFIIIDCTVSWTALIRGMLRRNNLPSLTPVGSFYDQKYPDEKLQHFFPNMNFLTK